MSRLARLYPLRGLPRQGSIWAWISFDVANQSFTLLINTLLFSIFFTQVVVTDGANRDTLWSLTFASSMLITVVLSPIFGAISDERAWKKECLVGSGIVCGILTCLFGLIGPAQLWFAVLLYIPANVAYSLGENFLASFLPELARRGQIARVSAFSWGIAYGSALVILVIAAVVMMVWDLRDPEQWRPLFVFAGAWFLVFLIPAALRLRERAEPPTGVRRSVVVAGFARLASSIRATREFRDLVTLLIASLFYGTGMSVVVFFASIMAQDFGFKGVQLVGFVGVITVSGIVGTLIPMMLQDRIGHKRTTVLLLMLWLVTTLSMSAYAWWHARAGAAGGVPTWPLWVLGNLLGAGLGSLGSANRAFVGYLAPESRTGEVFGLWGLVFKLAAVCTIPFAIVKDRVGTAAALLVLAAFILAGLGLTLLVNEKRGREVARGVDEEAERGSGGAVALDGKAH